MKIVEFCFAFSIAEVEGQARNETLNTSCDINICTLYRPLKMQSNDTATSR